MHLSDIPSVTYDLIIAAVLAAGLHRYLFVWESVYHYVITAFVSDKNLVPICLAFLSHVKHVILVDWVRGKVHRTWRVL